MDDVEADAPLACGGLTPIKTLMGRADGTPMMRSTMSADCPIRVVWGTKDGTVPFAPCGRPIVSAMPGAELEMLADVGHVPTIDDPIATAHAIVRLDAVEPRD